MIKFIVMITLLCSFLCSCELHEQEAYSQNNELSRKFASFTQIESLFKAITDDDYLKLQALLDEDPSLALVVNDKDESLLIKAVESKRLLSVRLLISLGADIDYRGPRDVSAVDIIKTNDIEADMKPLWQELLVVGIIPKRLLDNDLVHYVSELSADKEEKIWSTLKIYFELGANKNVKNERSFTPLMLAASKPLPLLTQRLCDLKDVDKTAINKRFLTFIKRKVRGNPQFQVILDILAKCGTTN